MAEVDGQPTCFFAGTITNASHVPRENVRLKITVTQASGIVELFGPLVRVKAGATKDVVAYCPPGTPALNPDTVKAIATSFDGPRIDHRLPPAEYSRLAKVQADLARTEAAVLDAEKMQEEEEMAAIKAQQEAKSAAEYARRRAVAQAKERAEQAQMRSVCHKVWGETIDRKLSDLTVRETQRVNACQGLGMYK